MFSRGYFNAYHVWVGRDPTIVLGWPPFPPDQDVSSFAFQDFFDPKQRVVRPLRFLDIGFVKRAFYRRVVPFTESIGDDGMTTDVRDQKHFFRPARQIAFFKGAVSLVVTHAIADSTFGRWGLGVQTLSIESVPHVGHGLGGDLMRSHADTAMIGVIVRMNQRL